MVTVGQAYAAENREKNRELNERLEKCFSETWKVGMLRKLCGPSIEADFRKLVKHIHKPEGFKKLANMILGTFKVIFVGDYGVGKSSILLRFTDNYFKKEKYGYCGHAYASRWIEHDDKKIKVGFWDTGGQEIFRALGTRGVHGAFLVYDTTKRASFENAEKWFQEIRNYSKQYGGSDPIVLLVGNKTDLESLREVTSEEAEMFAEANALLHIEVSALDSTNINAAFQILVGGILQGRFQCVKEEIKFREHHELWLTLDSKTGILSIFKDIIRICIHPDIIMTLAFLVCIWLYLFFT